MHLSVDAITKCVITKLENLATRYLKRLPRSVTHAILYYPAQLQAFHRCHEWQKLSLLSLSCACTNY